MSATEINTILILVVMVILFSNKSIVMKTLNKMRPAKEPAEDYLEIKNQLTLLEHGTVSMVLIDSKGFILAVNNVVTKVLGWTSAELIGRNITMLIPDRHRKSHLNGMRMFQHTGKGPIVNRTIEISSLTKDGNEIPIELTVEQKDEKGKNYFIGSIRDLSREHLRTVELKEQLNFHRTAEELLCYGLFKWDFPNDRVVMTETVLDIFDLSEEQNGCKSEVLTDQLVSTDREKVGRIIYDAIQNKESKYEMEYSLKGGKQVRTVAKIIYNEHRLPIQIIGAVRKL